MQNTKEILKWHLNFSEMKYAAEHVFSRETKSIVDISIRQLKELSERLPDGNKLPEKKLIKDVYFLFQRESHKEYFYLISLFSKRDTRILVYALDYQPENGGEIILFSEKFDTARKLILDNWKDSFIINLWHVLLKNWNNLLVFQTQREQLTELLNSKCNAYDKSRKDILEVTRIISFFLKKDSPKEFARNLISYKKLISDSHVTLKQKESILLYEYFSSVLEQYIDCIDINSITRETTSSIFLFLQKHNNKKITLISCSQIINSNKFNQTIDIVKNQTVSMVGDPIKAHLWRYDGLSRTQEESVESARKKLNILLNQHFIKVFFEGLVQDDRRKKYWLKFIDKIDDIKFSGSSGNYRYLKNIESVSKYVDSRYKITSRNQSTCALIIYSRNFVFVEFTDTGALYIYKRKNFRVNLNSISGMEDLKTWSRDDYACKNSDSPGYVILKEEGKIDHRSHNWEDRVDIWMDKYYHSSVKESESFEEGSSSNKTNEMFWESKILYWSKTKLPGYTYSSKKDAWWKYK
ncbi:EH signature domain-containing protein [Gaoshiqia sediminis]|uniref:EH signature domain-containing protein n=1 Tax=Gaoshiqia sediminis TaxID=2986998 RepID=A0AA41Y7M3_9BACT|nr:EH signature domain-containing protein [Gaoshiqia sediminis]MCW0482981.1 EH signature domain-containing protein [Gaoshiqia sediminis]